MSGWGRKTPPPRQQAVRMAAVAGIRFRWSERAAVQLLALSPDRAGDDARLAELTAWRLL